MPDPLAPPVPPRYGPPIPRALAQVVMAAAVAEAERNGWPMAIAIVDSSSHLVLFERLDQTQHGSTPIAIDKAKTAVDLRRPTRALEDAVAAGGVGHRVLSLRGVVAFEGGLPLELNGEIVGGIGVSGMPSACDVQVAEAGAAALSP